MRTNAILMYIIGVFFTVAAAGYTVWALLTYGWPHIEWVGTVAMTLTAIMGFFVGFYLGRVHKAQGGELPQDMPTADIDDDDPEIGHFAPWSWWPMVLAGALALVFLGLAVGTWVSFIGGPLVLIAVVGWNYEFYRGHFAR
jgi:hypothetical protein